MLARFVIFLFTRLNVRLIPSSEISLDKNAPHVYRSESTDSKFYCKFKDDNPKGWVFVRYRTNIKPGLQPLFPRLILDMGQGFSSGEVINLKLERSSTGMDVVYIPNGAIRIAISPCTKKGKFSLLEFDFVKIPKWAALAWVILGEFKKQQNLPSLVIRLFRALKMLKSKQERSQLRLMIMSRLTPSLCRPDEIKLYNEWISEEKKAVFDRLENIKKEIIEMDKQPVFSLILTLKKASVDRVEETITSVLKQIYINWELIIVVEYCLGTEFLDFLNEWSFQDSRINVNVVKEILPEPVLVNRALELVTGDYVGLIDHGDRLSIDSLYEFAKAARGEAKFDMIYSDEDRINSKAEHYQPFFKPAWSPDYLEEVMYTSRMTCYRTSIVKHIGGFKEDLSVAFEYDFVLRFTEWTQNIGHVEKVLYHWNVEPDVLIRGDVSQDEYLKCSIKALEGRLDRTGRDGRVLIGPVLGCFKSRIRLADYPLVSLVIPTAGKEVCIHGKKINLLINCIHSIVEKTVYKNFEIIVVDNGDLNPEIFRGLKKYVKHFVTYKNKQVNIAAKINLGAKMASGQYLLILNDDIEVKNSDWIHALLEQAVKPGVGAVGAKLYYENDLIQHVGVAFCDGLPDHVRRKFPQNDPGYFYSSVAIKNWLAVTGACMMTSRKLFDEVGGFGEKLPINYNDVDYCLKLISLNKRIVFTPHAELYHFESLSRKATVSEAEIRWFLAKWGRFTREDPYYNEKMLVSRPPNFISRLPSPVN